ncbi:MAG: response regulator transcription factor [Firmicutes bacterium]|nr:response regulator transcription factor [Bacillota bacterium]
MSKSYMVYIVEDEREIADTVVDYLKKEGYNAKPIYRGDTGMKELIENPPDLAILDIMLPGVDGLEILREVRKKEYFPVIFLTSRKDEVDRILGLEMGADDYVPKPFSPRELVSKVRSLFRRIEYVSAAAAQLRKEDEQIKIGRFTLSLVRRKLICGEASIELTATEFSIIEFLMKNSGKIINRNELLEYIWGSESGETRTVDVHINNLRKKMKAHGITGDPIKSIRTVGYAFDD